MTDEEPRKHLLIGYQEAIDSKALIAAEAFVEIRGKNKI